MCHYECGPVLDAGEAEDDEDPLAWGTDVSALLDKSWESRTHRDAGNSRRGLSQPRQC